MQVVALLVVTAMAVGMGWFTGGYLEERQIVKTEPTGFNDGSKAAAAPAAAEGEAPLPPVIHALDPITTNLADPSEIWVRMEVALVFSAQPDPALAEAIHQDLFAFMRTVKLRQIESASGFQHLKEDLLERARIRSDGQVENVLFRTFLFE
nr:flagellar basal body-associated FliL family protein [Nitratireductor luteus]